MDLTPRERGVLDQLEMLLRQNNSLQEAARKLAVMLEDQGLVERVVAARQRIANERRYIALDTALIDPEDAPEPWYTGPSAEDLFWPAFRATLEADPGWKDAVESLDAASTDVVGLLADPHSPTIATRGLVLGHVQSGKTANFTATIAKAADAGYRLFIVLSGVHNALRRQTQLRLDEQLYEPHKAKWLQLTGEHQDFGNPVKALALVAGTDLRLLAVVKKNVSRLTRLRDWLEQANAEGGLNTCPVLIIDDESDQASPNAARDPELDRTKINKLIVELLGLPRVAYIGYTATPFANVLINPADVRDMYPRSFIYALPKAPTYFGSEELFGRAVVEDDEDESSNPHDMIRTVPEEEAELYKVSRTEPVVAQVSPALAEAIQWFVLATAARRVRSGKTQHSSMLIHTTMRVDPQLQYLPVIREFVKNLRDDLVAGGSEPWELQWNDEALREPAERHGLREVMFQELSPVLPDVLGDIRVVADNSRSTERLIYTDDPAAVIAVGGNTLSRGLTLEGLVSSFFLRTASTYDSLLQMGRWFGYRPGYGDLPRIWTTEDLAEDFRFLAEVERDLRLEVDRYTAEGASPRELPVRLRLHPRMQVTAKNKMHFAVPGEASYSGQRPQTTYFRHRDDNELRANHAAARGLLNHALEEGASVERQASRVLVRDVNADTVIDFVERFAFHPDTELRSSLLKGYINGQREHQSLETWNLAVITRRPPATAIDLGLDQPVPLITRSKLARSSTASTANIGTLMSRPDRVADLLDAAEAAQMSDQQLLDTRTDSGRGLLLLYPIDKDSVPRPSAGDRRSPLEAVDHLVGVAFSFPRAAVGSEPADWIQVDPALLSDAQTDSETVDEYVDDEGDRDEVDLSDG